MKITTDHVGRADKSILSSQVQLIGGPHWSHQFVARGMCNVSLLFIQLCWRLTQSALLRCSHGYSL